jgi:hypothetical protein
MKIKHLLIIWVFAISLVQPVWGAKTIGVTDCGVWMNRKKTDWDKLAANIWLNGYMSGLSVLHELHGYKDNPLGKVTSAEQVHLWMDNYCQKNPLSDVSDGGDALFIELMKRK